MKIFIKHMVSMRCKILVKDELVKLGIMFSSLELGSVILLKTLSDINRIKLGKSLLESGLELQIDSKGILVEKIKHILLDWIDSPLDREREKYSTHLNRLLKYKYNYLSNIFTEVEGITIQTFVIKRKIEMVKELLSYGELNLNQIALSMSYSSSAHMSTQFKKMTGVSPSFFKISAWQKTVKE